MSPGQFGYVYVIGSTDGTGPVKFGWSHDPNVRVAQLRTGHPGELAVLGKMPGSQTEERALHRLIEDARVRGEWFERTPAVVEIIECLRTYLSYEASVKRMAEWGILFERPAVVRRRRPSHPGKVLETALQGKGVKPGRAAAGIGVSRPQMNAVLAGKSSLTPWMALRLGAYIGNDSAPEVWLGMQADYDLWNGRQKLKPELDKIKSAAA